MPTPATFQPPPTAIPEPPAFPSLMETQSPDAYVANDRITQVPKKN